MQFVVDFAGVQAVVELAEEFVEQVAFGLLEPVTFGSARVVVPPGSGGGLQALPSPRSNRRRRDAGS